MKWLKKIFKNDVPFINGKEKTEFEKMLEELRNQKPNVGIFHEEEDIPHGDNKIIHLK